MRVFLSSRTEPAAEFSEVLETACRSAGVDFDPPADAGQRTLRTAASRLHQLAEQEFERRTSALFASLASYFEHQGEHGTRQVDRLADPQSVAEELCITAQMTLDDLNRLRRRFALANHPDRAGSDGRKTATERMMIANMLIDREMKRRLSQRPPSS
jgi:hypothetical protein